MSRVNPVKFGEVQRLDEHHKAILDFIKGSPECTQNQVVKAMDEQRVCSKMTTLRKLDELKQRGEIIDSLKDGQSGFHLYYINNKSNFSQINEKLLRIETIIDRMNNILRSTSRADRNPEFLKADVFFMDLIYDLFDRVLHLILRLTTENISSEKDSKILYNKIIQVLTKVHSDYTFEIKLKNMLNARLGKISIKDYFESAGFDANLIHDMIETIESVEKELLTKSEQKDRHEK